MKSATTYRQFVTVTALALMVAACGDSKPETPAADGAAEEKEADIMPGPDAYTLDNIEFLEKNENADGVSVTETGLQYKLLDAGSGEGVNPKAQDFVTVHYKGRLIDGTEFDSSYRRGEPATFPLNRVIPGWTEGLQLMKVGQTMQFTIPSELGYGENGTPTGSIPPNSTLIFDVELLEIKTVEEVIAEQEKLAAEQERQIAAFREEQQAFLDENAKKDGVTVTESGLQYRVINSGSGATPDETSTVEVHYEGRLINGQVFDSSYQRGETIEFPVNGVIAGWTEALQLMKEGDKWEIALPYDIAYGERGAGGAIPPYATLVFDVELIKVK